MCLILSVWYDWGEELQLHFHIMTSIVIKNRKAQKQHLNSPPRPWHFDLTSGDSWLWRRHESKFLHWIQTENKQLKLLSRCQLSGLNLHQYTKSSISPDRVVSEIIHYLIHYSVDKRAWAGLLLVNSVLIQSSLKCDSLIREETLMSTITIQNVLHMILTHSIHLFCDIKTEDSGSFPWILITGEESAAPQIQRKDSTSSVAASVTA